MEEGTVVEKLPDLNLADKRFLLTLKSTSNKQSLAKEIKDTLIEQSMSGVFEQWKSEGIAELLGISEKEEEEMKIANETKVASLQASIDDAVANLGESEVREAHLAMSNYYCLIGRRALAVEWYEKTLLKTVALGQKLDIYFFMIRMGLFFDDSELIHRGLRKANKLMEEGSDWDRRNRLKIYEALSAVKSRNFASASSLFIQTLPTFASPEIFDFETHVFFTLVSSMVSLGRVELKSQILESSEVLSVANKIPHVFQLISSFHSGRYSDLFPALLNVLDEIERTRIISRHSKWLCREIRIKAYSQYLESYRSVQLKAMASAFGITDHFLDQELATFISINRIHCKIDKVDGTIETNRPDSKNSLYAQHLKLGDSLLNRIQKLAAKIVSY